MPIQTDITTQPPEVIINVSDTGPGGGKTRTLDLHVSWDPTILRFLSAKNNGHECPKGAGIAHWHKLTCPPSGKEMKLHLKRIHPGRTFVVTCVMDPETGSRKTARKKFPD